MKKFLITAGVLGALIAVPMNVQAIENPMKCRCERGYVTVTATSEKEIAPDTVEISISVRTEDTKSMQNAVSKNKETSDKVYATLKSMITVENGDSIKTSNYSANPIYRYNNSKRIFDKYQVSNNIIVKTKSIDKIGNIIDKAIECGASEVNNLNFSVSKYDNEYADLIAKATKKAKVNALAMAEAASTTLDGVKTMSVNYGSSQITNRVYYNAAPKMLTAQADGAVAESASPIEAGTVKIKVTVNASFYVK